MSDPVDYGEAVSNETARELANELIEIINDSGALNSEKQAALAIIVAKLIKQKRYCSSHSALAAFCLRVANRLNE